MVSYLFKNKNMTTNFPIGQTLLGISITEDQLFEGSELCLDQATLYFEGVDSNTEVIITPVADTDEISVQVNSTIKNCWSDKILSLVKGSKLSEVWLGKNSQGYSDLIVLKFKSVNTNVAFIAEGSGLKVSVYKPQQLFKNKIRNSNNMFAEWDDPEEDIYNDEI